MPLWLRNFLRLLAGIVGIPLALIGLLLLWSKWKEPASTIENFNPLDFAEKTDIPFFYSIGDELKYGDAISQKSPTLLTRRLFTSVMVSPDNRRALTVSNDSLYLVAADGSGNTVIGPLRSAARMGTSVTGQRFVREVDHQWSRDSRFVYLIKDEYPTLGERYFPDKAELWEYDVASGHSRLLIKPFPAHEYATGKNGGVYFKSYVAKKAVIQYFDGESVRELKDPQQRRFYPLLTVHMPTDTPFSTFSSPNDLPSARDSSIGVRKLDGDRQEFSVAGKPILVTKVGDGFMGRYHCVEPRNAQVLPGGRYVLVLARCGNYRGDLLIDASTGRYKTLPGSARIYPRVNTDLYPVAQLLEQSREVQKRIAAP